MQSLSQTVLPATLAQQQLDTDIHYKFTNNPLNTLKWLENQRDSGEGAEKGGKGGARTLDSWMSLFIQV